MDEATSALTAGDVETVNTLLRALRDKGTAILFISHRMHEVEALADTCSVFRSGRHIETFPQGSRSHHEIINLMIGREIEQTYPPKPPPVTAERRKPGAGGAGSGLEQPAARAFRLACRRGEILGLGGLDGQGQRELLLALFGVLKDVRGSMAVDGRAVAFGGPKAAMSAAIPIALVPEDRKTEGLLLPLLACGTTSASPRSTGCAGVRFSIGGGAAAGGEGDRALAHQGRLAVGGIVGTLSGGNQQKVVLGKWLATGPGILLLMDPTRGIDVGTKQELYVLIRQLADLGATVLFYSTDYDELIGMCDRVVIIYRGQVVRELSRRGHHREQHRRGVPVDRGRPGAIADDDAA